MHSKKPLIPLAILLIIAAGVAYWWYYIRVPEPKNIIAASGTIEATNVAVSSEITGRILAIKVAEGQSVKTNQDLAELEATALENRIEQARIDIANARQNLEKLEDGAQQVDINVYEVVTDSAKIASDDAEQNYNDTVSATEKDLSVAQAAVDNMLKTRNFALQEREEALADYEELVKKYEHPVYHIPNYTKTQEAEVDAAKVVADTAYNTFLTAENAYKAAVEAKAQADKKAAQARDTAAAAANAAEGNYKKAKAQLKQAEKPVRKQDIATAMNAVSLAEKRLEAVEVDLNKSKLKAPISGVVLTQAVEKGELAVPGKTLFEIGDLDKVQLSIFIAEDKLGLIKLGDKAKIRVDSYPKRTWEGKITKVADKAEFTPTNIQTKEQRVTTVFEVTIDISNKDHTLKPGMPADAEIKLADNDK